MRLTSAGRGVDRQQQQRQEPDSPGQSPQGSLAGRPVHLRQTQALRTLEEKPSGLTALSSRKRPPASLRPSEPGAGWAGGAQVSLLRTSPAAAALRPPRCHRVPAIHPCRQARGNLAGEPESDAGDARTDAGLRGSMA